MNFWRHPRMELWSHVLIVSLVKFFHVFSLTLPTILKSEFLSVNCSISFLSFEHYRVILSTIRYLAACPSPWTLIQKKYISALGTTVDEQRRQHLRIDDERRREKVETAHRFIFEKGLGVKSTKVESLLKEESYTPTRVRFWVSRHTADCSTGETRLIFIKFIRACSLPASQNLAATSFPFSFQTSYMSLNSVSGSQFSHTSCTFYTQLGTMVFRNWISGKSLFFWLVIVINLIQLLLDIVGFLLLDEEQFGDLVIMHHQWQNWLGVISKIFYKYIC